MTTPLNYIDLCPLCGKAHSEAIGNKTIQFTCDRCGTFSVGEYVMAVLYKARRQLKKPEEFVLGGPETAASLSGIARNLHEDNLPRLQITSPDFGQLLTRYSTPRTPLQKVDHLVRYLGNRATVEGERIRFVYERDFQAKSAHAFVAMWFNSTMDSAWENGFYPALKYCGWDPYRVDKERYNGKIDNRIIAKIREAGLVVADFTGQRAGAYYEAGFAKGLSKNVVFTVKKGSLKKVHFDTRQFTHVPWKNEEHLKEELIAHLEANELIGPGPRGDSSPAPTD